MTKVFVGIDSVVEDNVDDAIAFEVVIDEALRLTVARAMSIMKPLNAEFVALPIAGVIHFSDGRPMCATRIRLIVNDDGYLTLQLDHKRIAGHIESVAFYLTEVDRLTRDGAAYIAPDDVDSQEWQARCQYTLCEEVSQHG